jgi:hypothetical protein
MAMITGFIALIFKRRVDKDENRIIYWYISTIY